MKNGDDFRQLAFRSIEHPCVRGRELCQGDEYPYDVEQQETGQRDRAGECEEKIEAVL